MILVFETNSGLKVTILVAYYILYAGTLSKQLPIA